MAPDPMYGNCRMTNTKPRPSAAAPIKQRVPAVRSWERERVTPAAQGARARGRQGRAAAPVPSQVPVPPPRSPHVLEVDLSRLYFPDDEEEPVSWAAEWGLRDDPVGTEDSNVDVQQLIVDLLEDARRQWADRYDLSIEWELSGDAPRGKSVQDMLTELGVTLPGKLPPGPDCNDSA